MCLSHTRVPHEQKSGLVTAWIVTNEGLRNKLGPLQAFSLLRCVSLTNRKVPPRCPPRRLAAAPVSIPSLCIACNFPAPCRQHTRTFTRQQVVCFGEPVEGTALF